VTMIGSMWDCIN